MSRRTLIALLVALAAVALAALTAGAFTGGANASWRTTVTFTTS
jgi:hypothetical protein